jgi:hypothetical protein
MQLAATTVTLRTVPIAGRLTPPFSHSVGSRLGTASLIAAVLASPPACLLLRHSRHHMNWSSFTLICLL